MAYFVYILANTSDGDLYKGFTENPQQRLGDHQAGKSSFTSTKSGWHFVFLRSFETKREALIFERKIKRYNASSLQRLIDSGENQLTDLIDDRNG